MLPKCIVRYPSSLVNGPALLLSYRRKTPLRSIHAIILASYQQVGSTASWGMRQLIYFMHKESAHYQSGLMTTFFFAFDVSTFYLTITNSGTGITPSWKMVAKPSQGADSGIWAKLYQMMPLQSLTRMHHSQSWIILWSVLQLTWLLPTVMLILISFQKNWVSLGKDQKLSHLVLQYLTSALNGTSVWKSGPVWFFGLEGL